jgi:hypothetical protein
LKKLANKEQNLCNETWYGELCSGNIYGLFNKNLDFDNVKISSSNMQNILNSVTASDEYEIFKRTQRPWCHLSDSSGHCISSDEKDTESDDNTESDSESDSESEMDINA